jgi:hypothetical protein
MPRLATLASRFFAGTSPNGAEPAGPPTAASIQEQITTTRAELDALVAAHGAVAFAATAGDPEANQREQSMAEQITSLEGILRRLTAAHSVALAKEEEAARQLRLEAQAEQRKRAAKLLDKRNKHAADLEAAIGAAVAAYHKLHALNMRILAGFPYGSELHGIHLHPGELQQLVAFELHRVGGVPFGMEIDPARTRPSFPGGTPPNLDYRDAPERIPSLTTAIADANTHAINFIEQGKVTLLPVEENADV